MDLLKQRQKEIVAQELICVDETLVPLHRANAIKQDSLSSAGTQRKLVDQLNLIKLNWEAWTKDKKQLSKELRVFKNLLNDMIEHE
jgi:hypothetical protein